MEKAFQVQKQVRDNAKSLQTYLTDLQNWEAEMKRKEAALNGVFEQDLPPVRSKIKKDRPVQVQKKPEKRISSSDYKAWDNFDVDKACEEVDMEDVGPASLDGRQSRPDKLSKLREEAQYEKERGNTFVKHSKWDDAIACYNRAIELVKDDAIYYANRGLCYLMKESLHQAESDCTEALRLDPQYVKALQRRASARERLGSLRAASKDLEQVLVLEPRNRAASGQLDSIRARMGSKGVKSKSSPSTTPCVENKPLAAPPKSLPAEEQTPSAAQRWRDGVEESVTVIKTVKKPPHLRSKRALKSIPIHEIQLGKTSPERPPSRLKIIEIEDQSHGDSNNNDSNRVTDEILNTNNDINGRGDKVQRPQAEKMVTDCAVMEKDVCVQKLVPPVDSVQKLVPPVNSVQKLVPPVNNVQKLVPPVNSVQKLVPPVDSVQKLVPPVNSVQFMAEWKSLRNRGAARSDYLNIIEPSKIPSIFANALESDVLSDVIHTLAEDPDKFREKSVAAYLRGLCGVKRFSALAMFLSTADKESTDPKIVPVHTSSTPFTSITRKPAITPLNHIKGKKVTWLPTLLQVQTFNEHAQLLLPTHFESKVLAKLLHHCKVEGCTEGEVADLRNKYEL